MNMAEFDQNTPAIPIRESLACECKDWLNLYDDRGIATFCRTCIALYNHGGGKLYIGIDDQTGIPTSYTLTRKFDEAFHPDYMQQLIAKYASEQVPLVITQFAYKSQLYPVVTVGGGVIRPVFATRLILNPLDKRRPILDTGKIYVRTLAGGQYSSSTPETVKDWELLLARCFGNREVDLAGFVRRHFVGTELDTLRNALFQGTNERYGKSDDDLIEMYGDPINMYLQDGFQRCAKALDRRQVAKDIRSSWEVASIVSGNIPGNVANEEYYRVLMSVLPILSGIPMWMDTRRFAAGQNGGAVVNNDAWEQIYAPPDNVTQFGVIYEKPAFYLLRSYFEDLPQIRSNHDDQFIGLEFQIRNVAEVIATMLRFTKVVKGESTPFSISIKFHWRSLSGRKLVTFNDHGTRVLMAPAVQDEVISAVNMPWDLADDSIYKYVDTICRDLFKCFDGASVPINTTEKITADLFGR
jgi:hypothetical protein